MSRARGLLSTDAMTEVTLREVALSFEEAHRDCDELRDRLAATLREVDAFSDAVSHELRGPLRTISTFTQVLAAELEAHLDDRSRGHVRRVLAAAANMNERIESLLALSRVSQVSLARHPVDVTALVRTALEELDGRGESVGATVATGLEAEADGRLLQIAIEHLLATCVRLTRTSDAPHLHVGKADRAGETLFVVRHNGRGVDAAHAACDLGLATARRIIERHGGLLWAEPVAGGGACWFFTLPST